MSVVSELIHKRKADNSLPGARTDGAKLGLVIEGGGMRGVVSAGMVAAIEALGLLPCFDAVYGSSAGSINGAYLVAGQARFGTTIYYQDINNRQFLDLSRVLLGKPGLSLEFLLDTVAETIKPLQWDKVISSPIPLTAVASSLTHGHAVHMRDFTSKADLKECLRGSARIPVIAGTPVTHRGMRLWDALLFEPIPVAAALEDGCTHVLALLTRPRRDAHHDLSVIESSAIAYLIGQESKEAQKSYRARAHEYNAIVQTLESNCANANERSVPALAVQVSGTERAIKGTETNHETLLAGARAGFKAVYAALDIPPPHVVEALTPF